MWDRKPSTVLRRRSCNWCPKSEKVRNTYKQIFLWIDLERGISVQQQVFQPDGDYRLAKYSSIRLNEKISDEVFKLKTTGKTQTITPTG